MISMHIHLRNSNIPAKFHPNRIWNDGAIRLFGRGRLKRKSTRTRIKWVAIWDQYLIHKIL